MTPPEINPPRWTRSTLRTIAPRYTTAVNFAPDDLVWNLTLDQITGGTGKIINPQETAYAEAGTSSFIFDEETILYSKLRPYLNKVAWPKKRGVATTELVPLKPDTSLMLPGYLTHYLRSSTFLNFISNRVAGAKMPRVVMDEFWAHEIPHPTDLREQARIVELLDQADALRHQRAEADTKLARLLPALFRHHFGDPEINPQGFTTVDFDKALNDVSAGETKLPTKNFKTNGLLPIIDQGAAQISGYTDDMTAKFTGPTPVIIFGDHTRNFKYVNHDFAIGADGVRVLSARSGFAPEFLYCHCRLLNIPSAGYSRHMKYLRAKRFIQPPMPLQETFAKRMESTRELRTQAATSAAKLEILFQTLLHRAFTGELTAKWREAHLREGVQEMNRAARI